ncbi:CHAT domain-containing protein [Aetokthonos hydrillicola Thurmond2011]|jgi:CHAT domain-containing protein/TPR repeat protein|uniref:CHAT domain-containing protein n=2 Tax=Aetokthonos TaxID=1550243 RepID=A0AAP5IEG3_9CYAN|nr:CHAT domain-containing protein [Aetokthonos hydrillicola Thurmond2011]
MMMDEQRQEAYLNFINELLICPNGKEIEILQANPELIDEDLVEIIKQVVKVLHHRGDNNNADFLDYLAHQISQALLVSENPVEESTNQQDVLQTANLGEYFSFLEEILNLTANSQNNPEIVYSLLNANLNLLNDNLVELLYNWGMGLSEMSIDQAQLIAADIVNFSILISDFSLGNPAINVEIAITGYNVAANVFTRDAFPQQWATIQDNLGIGYDKRIRGQRAENIELAIGYYLSALEIRTREAFPEKWAETKSNLGIAYFYRLCEDRAENLELAIRHLLAAQEILNCKTASKTWSAIQHNLGTAYLYRLRAERSENLEEAIKYYEGALKVRTRETVPDQWAETQNNLGVTYLQRIRGKREENLEAAICCYNSALAVYTRETLPLDWAMTKHNLGEVYLYRVRGNRAENVEISIDHHLDALKVRTREALPEEWAETQNNLGTAYDARLRGERADNLELAISCYEAALEVRTRETFSERWAGTQNNLGNAYRNRIFGKKAENLQKAISCLSAALEVRTREAFSQYYVETQWNLGLAYKDDRQFHNAYTAFAAAIDTLENYLRAEIVSGSGIEADKQKLAEEWNKLYQGAVEVCLELDYCDQAIEYVERSKNRNLVELILTKDRHTIFPADAVTQLDRLRDEIASSQYQLQNATAEEPTALAQHLQQLRQQRNELQNRYLSIGSGFVFEPFRSTLSDRTAIVEFYITSDKLLVFIITKPTQQPIVLPDDSINPKKLENWANSYLKAYSNQKSHWQCRLTTRLHLLAKILHIDEIIKHIPTECDQLIIIPHRYLHLLPLHALPLAGDSSLFERFSSGVSYAPSCQILQLAQTRQRPEFTHLFAVKNPTGDLTYTDIEVETIQSYFNTSNILKQQIATLKAIDNTSLASVHCVHFSCHGYFNTTQPSKSALILANGYLDSAPTQPDAENYLSLEKGSVLDLNKCLTLDSIFTLNLEKCRLVTLSACETGLIDFRNTSDEYIGLPSGFLYAGAFSVVSSLWTVDDLSTAFLMLKFYQNLHDGLPVALALNQAQLWLKNLTKGDLEKWIQENQLPLKPAVRVSLRRRLYPLEPDTKLFKLPFYWAAFCAVG